MPSCANKYPVIQKLFFSYFQECESRSNAAQKVTGNRDGKMENEASSPTLTKDEREEFSPYFQLAKDLTEVAE